MPQSLAKIYIHLIFHIKNTSPQLLEKDWERMHAYIGQLVNETGCKHIWADGVGDHVHILFLLSKDESIAHVVEEVKRNSSRWIKNISRDYMSFAWQGGYAAFSVSQSVAEKTLQYIKQQREHHKKHTFAEEYKRFLELYDVEYNSDYVFRD
ncbi:transposase [Prevotellamassilia timonensis]|jgi:putative transposase|uniref:transposase n=1 Tax=Prevotellamassilia timonensis TaxID=1852370 RepID=UPI003FF11C9E